MIALINMFATPNHLKGITPIKMPVNHLWRRVYSDQNLQQAFDGLCRQSEKEGGAHPNSDLWDYRRNWAQYKSELQQRLASGDTQLQPVSIVECRNEQGQMERRELRSAEDRLIIRAVAQVLQPALQLRLSPTCTHLKGNGGLQGAVRDTQEYITAHPDAQVIQSDVKGYYANIDHHILAEQLHRLLPNEIELKRLLWRFMRRTTEFVGNYSEIDQGLPLGTSLSPLLGALYLSPLDRLAKATKGSFYRRYRDDWVWVLPKRRGLGKALKQQSVVLQALGVEMHPEKTFIGKVEKGFDFLGFHCRPTGLGVADAALSRREEKVASKRRVGAYLARWFGLAWVLWACSAGASSVSCPDSTSDDGFDIYIPVVIGSYESDVLSCSGNGYYFTNYDGDSHSHLTNRFVSLHLPDAEPRSGDSYPAKIHFRKLSDADTSNHLPATFAGTCTVDGDASGYTVSLADGGSCSLVGTSPVRDGGSIRFSTTLSRSGSVYHSVDGTIEEVADSTAPTVTFNPLDSATGVAVDSNIIIEFNEPIQNLNDSGVTDFNVGALITLKDTNGSGSNIGFNATIDAGKTIITINPASNLFPEQVVYVAIGATVEDDAGNAITASSATFTAAAATVTFNPLDSATGVAVDSDITIEFDSPIRLLNDDPVSDVTLNFTDIITLKDTNASGSDISYFALINESKTVITINPSSDFSSEQVVYVRLNAELEYADDNAVPAANATFTAVTVADSTAPTITGTTVATDNATIAVTFSEEVFTTTGGTDALVAADFTLAISGGTATLASPTPSNIASSGNIYTLGLSLSGTPNGSETLTVVPSSSTAIYDAADNAASTTQSNNSVTLNDQAVPTITGTTVATNNSTIDVTFSEAVFTTTGGADALVAADFALSISGGTTTVSATPSSISINGNIYTLGLSLTGTPDGSETLTVLPSSSTAIYDATDNAASTTQTNNSVTLNEQAVPTITGTTLAADNSSIDVTFSEAVFTTTGGADALVAADFALSISGGTATVSATPSSISINGNTYTLGLSLSGTPDGNETLTVVPSSPTAIYDADNNAASTTQSNNSVTLIEQVPPTITGTTVAADNATIDVTFSEAVFTTTGGAGALLAADFTLAISGGTATVSATPSSITISGNTYTLGLSLTGTPDGNETLTVVPSSATAIYDAANNAASTSQSDNSVTLNDMTGPDEAETVATTQQAVQNFAGKRMVMITSQGPGISGFLGGDGLGGGFNGFFGDSPVGLNFSGDSDRNQGSFSTSLQQFINAEQRAYTRKLAQNGAAKGEGIPNESQSPIRSPANIWIKGRWTHAKEDRGNIDEKSDFGIVYIGTDWRHSKDLLIGLMGQIDWSEEKSTGLNVEAEGKGWMLGPYVVSRLTDTLTLDLRGAWGQSDNKVNPLGTYWDSYDSERWQIEGNLTGSFDYDRWHVAPSLGWNYFEEKQKAYTDNNGFRIGEQTASLGSLNFGPTASYTLRKTDDGLLIRPLVGLKGVWDFDAPDITAVNGLAVGTEGLRAQLKVGINLRTVKGLTFQGSYIYDGIGVSDFESHTAELILSMPLRSSALPKGSSIQGSYSLQGINYLNSFEQDSEDAQSAKLSVDIPF